VITQDYSVWLDSFRLAREEQLWAESEMPHLYANRVRQVIEEHGCRSVIELGCGTGWVPTLLPGTVEYVGVDGNPECLQYARQKTTRLFLHADIRGLRYPTQDLVCSFAVLKHFALEEWPAVLGKVLSHGRVGLFTMNVGPGDRDDFNEGFAHTWVSAVTLDRAVEACGHRIRSVELLHTTETMVKTCIR